MKEKISLLLILILLIIFSGCTEIEEKKQPDQKIELNDKFIEWYNKSKGGYDFDHPYISCIFENTCNGTFLIGIEISSEENISQINNTLSKYGKVTAINCFTNVLKICRIRFEIHDIYLVDNFINFPFIKEIYLARIESDYKLNISEDELYFCENDQDCTTVVPGCCGCNSGGPAISINQEYENKWNSYMRQECTGTGCAAVMSQHISCFSHPECTNNKCTLVPNKEYVCNSLLFVNCIEHTPEEQWDNIQRGNGISCRDVIDMCE